MKTHFLDNNNPIHLSFWTNSGAQPNLSKNIIEELRLIEPTKVIMEKHPFVEIMKLKESYTFEIKSLMDLQNIVLSKMTKVETEKETVEN